MSYRDGHCNWLCSVLLLQSSSVGLEFCLVTATAHSAQASWFCKYETADLRMVSFWESKLTLKYYNQRSSKQKAV